MFPTYTKKEEAIMKRLVITFDEKSMSARSTRRIILDLIYYLKEIFDEIVIVISAIGGKTSPYSTETLLRLFANNGKLPNNREQALVSASAEILSGAFFSNELAQEKIKNIFLSCREAGIKTDESYIDANILGIETKTIEEYLSQGYVVLVPGGQGLGPSGDITTLGVGGSDTTACALAYYLKADELYIYKGNSGIYTGEPNLLFDRARNIAHVGYELCLSLARCNPLAINPKALEYARLCPNTTKRILSIHEEGEGSYIGEYANEDTVIFGVENTTETKSPDVSYPTMLEYLQSKCPGLEEVPRSAPSAIFVIGKKAEPCRVKPLLGQTPTSQVFQLAEDSLFILLELEHYDELYTRLHDGLCLDEH